MKLANSAKPIAILLALLLFVAPALGQARPRATRPARPRPPRAYTDGLPKFEDNPPRHVGDFPVFGLAWQADGNLRDVRAVYPHPYLARRAVVVTDAGLMVTDDACRTWKAVPETAPQNIGAVRHVEFTLESPNVCYLASATKGVWRISDFSKPPVQIGSKANGLPDDGVVGVHVDGADLQFATLLAVHGDACAGLSRSQDGGKTWSVVPATRDYFIHKFVPGGPGVSWAFMAAAHKDDPQKENLYLCISVGEPPRELARDVQATDVAVEVLKDVDKNRHQPVYAYWATASSGIIKVWENNTAVSNLQAPEGTKWSSIGVTWGATADTSVIFAYSPSKAGLLASSDGGKTFAPCGEGLPGGSFIKEGAHVRANAGGTLFLAAINNTLYVARRYTGPLDISGVSVTPGMCSFSQDDYQEAVRNLGGSLAAFKIQRNAAAAAKDLVEPFRGLKTAMTDYAVTITAGIAEQGAPTTGPAEEKPASVSIDLSRLGGQPRTPMFDDGMHGDGAAGDGVYGAVVTLRPDRLPRVEKDWRRPWPGAVPLTITAVGDDGSLSSAVAVLGLAGRLDVSKLWVMHEQKWDAATGGIDVKLDQTPSPLDKTSLKVAVKNAPWTLPLYCGYQGRSVQGYYAVAFWVRSDAAGKELNVALRDMQTDAELSTTTTPVPVVKEGLVEGGAIDSNWRRVVVPVVRLLKDDPKFRPAQTEHVILSGDAAAGQSLWLSEFFLVPTAKDLQDKKIAGGTRQ